MKESIETAIKVLTDKIHSGVSSSEALHYSQAALNLAHVLLSIQPKPERHHETDQ